MPPSSALFLSPLSPSNTSHPPSQRPIPLPLLRQSPCASSFSSSSSKPLLLPRFHCLPNEIAQEKDTIPLSPFLEKPWMQAGETVKIPTAPWMRAPLLLPSVDVLDLSKSVKKKSPKKHKEDPPLTEKVRGGRNRKAMRRIVEWVARLREIDPVVADEEEGGVQEEGGQESMLSIPLEQAVKENKEQVQGTVSRKMPWEKVERPMVFRRIKKEKVITAAELTLPKVVLARLRSNAKTLTKWVKAKKAGVTQAVVDEIRMTWKRSELAMIKLDMPLSRNMDRAREIVETKTGGLVVWSKKGTLIVYRGTSYQQTSEAICASVHPDCQESSLSKGVLEKSENHPPASSVQSYDGAGVSVSLQDEEYYSKCVLGKSENHPPASSVQSYDGAGVSVSLQDEKYYSKCVLGKSENHPRASSVQSNDGAGVSVSLQDGEYYSKCVLGKSENHPPASSVQSNDGAGVSVSLQVEEYYSWPTSNVLKINEGTESVSGTLYEREANRLLNGLGPRFIDWWWSKPLPVDADLLPETVPNFRTPFRLCPPRVRRKLTDDELTQLRKLARPLPTHFALGKNTKLQGLAAAIIKLWEKCPIAKIAVKTGIPNTNNEQMSFELKRLTGGTLILRNKFFIILYRGKDYLPGSVANSISAREKELNDLQLQEEQARSKSIEFFHASRDTQYSTSSSGTFMEFYNIQEYCGYQRDGNSGVNVQIEVEKLMLQKELRKHEHQLLLLQMKIERSQKELATLSSKWRPPDQAADQELLTEEERQAFRKIGLKMDEFMLMGRRGIFEGVIRNIHLHWKHREIVKVLTMQRTISQVTCSAKLLELESGGILIGIEKLGRGHAILIYRGKNYRTPLKLLPGNLLTKREALQRSIEIQRRGSLKYFAYQRQQTILELKRKLRDLEERSKELTPRENLNQLPP